MNKVTTKEMRFENSNKTQEMSRLKLQKTIRLNQMPQLLDS